MSLNIQRFRTAVITSKLVGPLVRWGWRQYVVAIAVNAPNDCAEIPKVEGAGRCVFDSDGAYQIMHNGLRIKQGAYYGDLNTAIIERLQGHHEPQEELVFHRVLQQLPPASVMLEAGSYWGYYSLWFKKERPKGSAFLIEPLEDRLDLGKLNFRANGMSAEFLRAYVGASSKPPHTIRMEGETITDIERVSIDDLMERYKLAHVDLLHADVQGAELDLLKGAEKALRGGKIGYIFISTHGSGVHNDCMRLLADYDFQVIASHTREESFTTDGLIVARSKKMVGPSEIAISKKHSSVIEDLRLVARYVFSSHSRIDIANKSSVGVGLTGRIKKT